MIRRCHIIDKLMISKYSVKALYPLALAEGEGMGTAYEYYVKRKALRPFLAEMPQPEKILIAGLPQKYGASLDFMLLASELGAEVTVVDDRQQAIDRLRDSLAAVAKLAGAPAIRPPAALVVADLDSLSTIGGSFDLALSSEVLQRLSRESRELYAGRLRQLAGAIAMFCPNADNEAHNSRSGLAGLELNEIRALAEEGRKSGDRIASGYIDMPPFPPGITRTAEQREDATSGGFEGLVMWGLQRYAHVERFLPISLRRRHAHIVYALSRN